MHGVTHRRDSLSSYETMDAPAELFASVRPQLLPIAYRMLGSVADAEDPAVRLFVSHYLPFVRQ